jgi:hypothetical protein
MKFTDEVLESTNKKQSGQSQNIKILKYLLTLNKVF